jgi:hypothetical protein
MKETSHTGSLAADQADIRAMMKFRKWAVFYLPGCDLRTKFQNSIDISGDIRKGFRSFAQIPYQVVARTVPNVV